MTEKISKGIIKMILSKYKEELLINEQLIHYIFYDMNKEFN